MPKKPFPPATSRPTPHRPPTREEIERARTMYKEGFTVSRCLAATNMSLGTFYYWLDGGPVVGSADAAGPHGGDGRDKFTTGPAEGGARLPGHDSELDGERAQIGSTLLPPIPRRREVVGKRRKPLVTDRVSLTARLWRTAERQVRDIEQRLAAPAAFVTKDGALRSPVGPERERDVRMLSVLVRTLRDLAAFDAVELTGAGEKAADQKAPSRSVEELRASVMRKLQGMIAQRDEPPGGAPKAHQPG